MNIGLFQTQLSESWKAISELGLDGDRTWHPNYSLSTPSDFRHLNYLDTWRLCIQEQLYDFQLIDNSLLQFRAISFDPLNVSYAYYECPYRCVSYSGFLRDGGFEYDEVRDEFRTDYDEYLTTCDLKESVTPIRYDFSPKLYNPGLHPASHIHFGFSTHIRVGTKKVLRPLSFMFFVLRQCYPESWQRFVGGPDATLLCRNIREHLTDVDVAYWQSVDDWEMALV